MDFEDTPHQAAFRETCRQWLSLVLAATTTGATLERARRDVDDLGRGAVLLR